MQPAQEAYLELLAAGLNQSEACRRLGIGRSQPGYWAATSQGFERAYRPHRGRFQKKRIGLDVVRELTELLTAQGYVDAAQMDDLHAVLATFFLHIGALQYKHVSPLINRCARSLGEQRQIVDSYIELKKSKAGTIATLHEYLETHRVSAQQIGRWARRFHGPQALAVGPYQPGITRSRVLNFVQSQTAPMRPRAVAEALGMQFSSVREYLRILAKAGTIKKQLIGRRIHYASA